MLHDRLEPNVILTGPLFPEPLRVILVQTIGASFQVVAEGVQSGKVLRPVLNEEQLSRLEASPETEPFDGDPHHFRLGIEALRLGLTWEHDPYFSLSIARVDPLPHYLEAVYD